MHFCSNCYLGIITSMTHKCFPVGIPKRQEFRRHGNKLVAAPSLWNVTICSHPPFFFFFYPSLPLDQRSRIPSFSFCPSFLCPFLSLVISVFTFVLVRQPVISQNEPSIASIPLLPTDTPTRIILSPLFLLAWDRWLLSQLI